MKYLDIFTLLLALFCYILFYCIFSPLEVSSLTAEERLPLLKKGMSYIEVVKLWGSPKEKIEKEVKRKDIWVYNNSKLIFDNGSLVSVINASGVDSINPANDELQIAQKNEADKAKQNAVGAVPAQDVVDDILSEIMKDPSNSEGADSRPVMPQNPAQVPPPNMINQIPPEVVN